MPVRYPVIEQFALNLPGVVAAPHFHFNSWQVAGKASATRGGKPAKPGKIFVTIPPGETVLHVFLPDDARERIFAMYPDCAEKLFWGQKVCGVRVLLEKAALADVKAWVKAAWVHNGGERAAQPAEDKPAKTAKVPKVTAQKKPAVPAAAKPRVRRTRST